MGVRNRNMIYCPTVYIYLCRSQDKDLSFVLNLLSGKSEEAMLPLYSMHAPENDDDDDDDKNKKQKQKKPTLCNLYK